MPARPYLTPADVARLFRVDAKTVTRWANAGKLPSIKTPGGHHRFDPDEIEELVAASRTTTEQAIAARA